MAIGLVRRKFLGLPVGADALAFPRGIDNTELIRRPLPAMAGAPALLIRLTPQSGSLHRRSGAMLLGAYAGFLALVALEWRSRYLRGCGLDMFNLYISR